MPMGRQMVLTPLAQDLVQPVRDLLLQVQQTIVTKPRFEAATSTRHFSIAVSDGVTSVLMVEVLRDIQSQSPSITFELRPVGRRATDDLESGDLDFLIAPELYASSAHPKETLFEDTHLCVAWSSNRAIGATISVDQYLSLGHVIVHVGEPGSANSLVSILEHKAGRLIVNGFPTGVEVCPSMHHGGPYPATTDSRSTSVGTAAINRFARPVACQNFRQALLPAELPDGNPRRIRRLVDGAPTKDGW